MRRFDSEFTATGFTFPTGANDMKKLGLLLGIAVGILVPNAARASIVEQYVTDATSYTGSGSVNVNIYLQETVTGSDQTLIGNSAVKGLFSYGWYTTQTSGSSSGQSTLNSYNPNTPWNVSPYSGGSSSGSLPSNSMDYAGYQAPGSTSSPSPTNSGNTWKWFLGTLTVNVGTQTTFSLVSMNSSQSGLLDNGDNANTASDNAFTLPSGTSKQYDLDKGGTQTGAAGQYTFTGANAGLWQFTVGPSSTPEPSSIALCGIALLGGAGAGYRRWRAARMAEPVAA
jgi:hypothetical protein